MQVSCLQENLAQGLATVSRVIGGRSAMPITQNVYMATDNGTLKLSGTNLEQSITTWVGAAIEFEGAITVPARLLTELVNTFPRERVDLKLDGNQLDVSCGRSNSHFNTSPADEFPPIPHIDEEWQVNIESQVLKDAIGRTAFASASEESRPILTGLCVKLDGENFTLAAADGFRLAVQTSKLSEPVSEASEVIVPTRTMNELSRLLGQTEEAVQVMVSSRNHIMFRTQGIEIVSQLLQGSFPNYEQLIPASYNSKVVLNIPPVLKATKSAAIFARDGSNIIRFEVHEDPENPVDSRLVVSAKSESVGDSRDEVEVVSIETAQKGGEKIAFNSKYLQDILSAMEKGQMTLETTSPSSPGVFRPTNDDSYVHVIMPMFVQW